MPIPLNPYVDTPGVPGGVIEHQSVTTTVVTDPDGTTTPIGVTEETVIVDPATGARRALVTHHRMRDHQGNAILNPEQASVTWCATCNRRLIPQHAVTPCVGCATPTCAQCRRTSKTGETWCQPCWQATRWRRALQWLLSTT